MKNVRALAARVLLDAEKVFVDEALEAHRNAALSRRDRALLTTLVYGVTRRRRSLDWLIDRCARRVHPEIRQHLRVALFQVRYLTRIPRHAAVNEAVELARGVSGRAAGFANAVLRKASDMELPDNPGVLHSHPEWLVQRWQKQFEKLEPVLEAGNAVLPVTARVNRLRVADGPDVIVIEGDPAAHAGFEEGHFTVQDETSMKVAPLLGPRPGERVLDLCSSPGGKTTHLAELMGDQGRVVAVDLPDRIGLVIEAIRRLKLKCVETVVGDGMTIAFREPFDAVLVDAPCSNTGVLARRADARWRLQQGDIARAAALQERLLANAASLVRPGGRLVYSTCTLEPEENRLDLRGFRVEHEETTLPTPRHSGGFMALAIRL